MKKNQIIIVAVVVLLVVAGGSFYGGMVFGQNQKRNNFAGQNQNISIRGNRQGGGFNFGDIIAKDEKSITIKLLTGGSKIIFYSNTTEIGKFTSGIADDLAVGKSVSVTGNANPDGSITATNIQIRPAGQTPPK